MIINGNDKIDIKELKCYLTSTFKMKDLGPLTYFLGLEVSLSDMGIYLYQGKYAEDLLIYQHAKLLIHLM